MEAQKFSSYVHLNGSATYVQQTNAQRKESSNGSEKLPVVFAGMSNDDALQECSNHKTIVELSDDPNISSAALCIQLFMLDHTFRPEYTHQCFPGESIRGYQPRQEVLTAGKRHKSYDSHDAANQELSVVVRIAPSGKACNVDVNVQKKRLLRLPRNSLSKRPKVRSSYPEQYRATAGVVLEDSESSEDLDNDEEEGSDYNESDTDEETGDILDPEGATRHSRMSRAEIVKSLQLGLPDIVVRSVENDYLKAPVGVELHTYSRDSSHFCISLAKGDEAASYHNTVQRIALLFVENADDADVASEDGGYWKVLYLFQKHSAKKFSLAGYVTLFHFSAPFRKPTPGTIVRVCQAVVMPPYQRSGHGRQLLHKVHDLAQGRFDSELGHQYGQAIVEINVEDPAPGFVALRNLVDFERYEMAKTLSDEEWFENACADFRKDAYFELLSEAQALQLSQRTKLTVHQMQIVYEIDRLRGLPTAQPRSCEQLEKKYRLMVKKRLNRDYKEELGMCRNKDEMKKELERMYNEQKSSYDRILRRAHPLEK